MFKPQTSTFKIRSEKGRHTTEEIFLQAVVEGNIKEVENCISNGVDPNVCNEEKLTALHIAAENGNVLMGKQLLEAPNININSMTLTGYTPLMNACIFHTRGFVKLLLKNGANPNLTNDKGQTALHISCTTKNLGITLDLVTSGAKVNVVDVFDRSPLSIAVTDFPSISITRFLLRRRASATRVKGFPLFLECVFNCNTQKRLNILELLISSGVFINCVHPMSRMNCLHYVAITDYMPAAEFLLTSGANYRAEDAIGRTPLKVAMQHENREMAKFFRSWVNDSRNKRVHFLTPSKETLHEFSTFLMK